ncbi:MAG: efflux RND transporter periplasmic adaptor subunit [Bacteroidales bacterium]
MKRFLVSILAIIVVGGSAVGGYLRTRKAARPEVATQTVTRGDVVHAVGATGTLEAVTTVDVGTQVSGVVKSLYVDFNSIVRKGDLVATIDPATIEAQIQSQNANIQGSLASLERLQIALDDARNKLRRAEGLFARTLVPEQDLETAQANVKSAAAQVKAQEAAIKQQQAALNQLQVNLGYTSIHAPVDGIIINRKVDVGQTVVSNNMATSLFQIAEDLTKMRLKANVDESDVGVLRPGQPVTFRVDAYAEREFTGTVAQVRLQPVVTQNVVTYVTMIEVPNPDLELKPGMTANVKIEIARRENVLLIPVAALRFRATGEVFDALKLAAPPDLNARPSGTRTWGTVETGAGGTGRASSEGIADRGAATIDALFGPLTFPPSAGRVWAYTVDEAQRPKSLMALAVQTGLSDGTWAELLEGPGLREGTAVVTAVDTGQASRPAFNPLMPNRMGGGDHGGGHGGPH